MDQIPPKNSFCSIPPKKNKLPIIGNHKDFHKNQYVSSDQVSAARITGADDVPESNASKVQFKA